MNVLIAASATLTLFALLFFASTVRHARRGRLLRAGGSATCFAASAAIGTAGILLFISYLGYERLTEEKLVGVISIRDILNYFTERIGVSA